MATEISGVPFLFGVMFVYLSNVNVMRFFVEFEHGNDQIVGHSLNCLISNLVLTGSS